MGKVEPGITGFQPKRITLESQRLRDDFAARSAAIIEVLRPQIEGVPLALIPYGSTVAGLSLSQQEANEARPSFDGIRAFGSDIDVFVLTESYVPLERAFTIWASVGKNSVFENIGVGDFVSPESFRNLTTPRSDGSHEFSLLALALLLVGDVYVATDEDATMLASVRRKAVKTLTDQGKDGEKILQDAAEVYQREIVKYQPYPNQSSRRASRAYAIQHDLGETIDEWEKGRVYTFPMLVQLEAAYGQ